MGADYKTGHRRLVTGANGRNIGNLAAGATYNIPNNETLIGVTSADVDFPDLRLEIQMLGSWRIVHWEGAAWAPAAGTHVDLVPMKLISDGTNVRLRNTGANVISTIHITYEN